MATMYCSRNSLHGTGMTDDIVKSAQGKLKADQSSWSEIYEGAREDLHFLSDDKFAQWDEQDYLDRTSTRRPALTIDQLSQFVHQVANDIRQNTPTINVIPSGYGSDVKIAEIYKGLIKNIEYQSNADDAYDTASLNSIKSSIGFIRIEHDYFSNETDEQELKIKRVPNPLSCWLDSDSIECDGRDAKHATIIDKITVSEFKRRWPDFDPVCFESDEKNDNKKAPKDDEYVSIAEHFVVSEEDGISPSGRPVKTRKILRYMLSGRDVLEETVFPGRYIPLVPVYGEEHWVNGKRSLFSLIRKAKGAQKMYNYWKSLETELLMKQPNAPIMAAEGQLEPYTEDWKNPSKAFALRYSQVDAKGNPAPAPSRLDPPTIPTGVVNAARATVDDIKATMGIYNASLGQRSNESSGVAIRARQSEGDVATYHFGDNLVRSITHVGRILVYAIPEIYDTPRIIRVVDTEDDTKEVGINGAVIGNQEQSYDLSKGKYDVRVVTGASFTTRRQEAAQFFSDIVTKVPDLMPIMGDLLFKNMDFTGAPAMAERIKKTIDPKLLDDGKNSDPEKLQMQQKLEEAKHLMQTMQQEMLSLQQQLKDKHDETQIKIQEGMAGAAESRAKIEVQKAELQLKEQEANAELQLRSMELQLKARELDLKEMQMKCDMMKHEQEMQQAANDAAMQKELAMANASGMNPMPQMENENE